MNEIAESDHGIISLSIDLDLKYSLFKYYDGDESALNGQKIRKIFNYLKNNYGSSLLDYEEWSEDKC